jgi:hypothetical protein
MAAAINPPETASAPSVEEVSGRGHIGLVVLGSMAFGLIHGVVLVLGVFGGGRENVITGGSIRTNGAECTSTTAVASWLLERARHGVGSGRLCADASQ